MRWEHTVRGSGSVRLVVAVVAVLAMVVAVLVVGTGAAHAQDDARDIEDDSVCDPDNTEEAPFDDKPERETDQADSAIDCIWTYGLAEGTSEDEYSPAEPVTREQMISFLVRLLRSADQYGVNENPPPAPWTDRQQIASVHSHNADVANDADIAQGYANDNHFHPRPSAPSCQPGNIGGPHVGECGLVNRATMASFVVRTLEAIAGEEFDLADVFDDECPQPHDENVQKLAAADAVEGRETGFYDCLADTRRDQMALFLARGMDALDEEYGITFTPVEEGEPYPPPQNQAAATDTQQSQVTMQDTAPDTEEIAWYRTNGAGAGAGLIAVVLLVFGLSWRRGGRRQRRHAGRNS